MRTPLEWSFDLDAMYGCRRPMMLAFTDQERQDTAGILAHVKNDSLVDSVTGAPLEGVIVFAWAPLTLPSLDEAVRYTERRALMGDSVR